MESRQYKCPECKRRFYDLPLQNQGSESEGLLWLLLFELIGGFAAVYMSVISLFVLLGIGSFAGINKKYKTCPFCGTRSLQRVKGPTKGKVKNIKTST